MEIVLKNAIVADGDGGKPCVADLRVRGGVIADIRPEIAPGAAEVLDLNGLWVTPGFVDTHSHDGCGSPAQVKVRQGITTEVTGNCGLGYFPHAPGMSGYMLAAGLPPGTIAARDYAAYCTAAGPTVTKQAALVPYWNLCCACGGTLAQMEDLLARCMEQGAVGLSAGPASCHAGRCGLFPTHAELLRLCRLVARYDGVFAIHLRNEFAPEPSVNECIALAEQTGVRVQISHIKAVGDENKGRARAIIGLIKRARARGLAITADCYPYTASMTGFAALAPDYAAGIAQRGGAGNIMTSQGGKSLETLAKEQRVSAAQLAERLAAAGEAALFTCMDAVDVDAFLTTPWVMVGTDGVSRPPVHPRTYGAFARYLATYVREKKLLAIEEAVRKITSLPADVFGLTTRGRLRKGYAADLVVLDMPRVSSAASYESPAVYPEGIAGVMIDGAWVYRVQDETAGRLSIDASATSRSIHKDTRLVVNRITT